MPDRSGNNRIDSFRNIVEGFGLRAADLLRARIDETLRVGGSGRLSADPELMAAMVEFASRRAPCCRSMFGKLFPLRQGADALETVVAGDAGRTIRAASISEVIHDQTSLGEPVKPGSGREPLQDAAVTGAERSPRRARVKPGHDEALRWLDAFGRVRLPSARSQPADVLLGVEFKPDALDQIELGFEEVDVVFLVLHQPLEQVAPKRNP